MKTHKHLCSLENILAASRDALKNGKRAKPPGARYFADLEKHAVRLRRELLEGTYRHGGYTYFTVHEPKERLVAAAFRDYPRVQRLRSRAGRPRTGGRPR